MRQRAYLDRLLSRPVDSLDVDVEGLSVHQVRVVGGEVTVAVSRLVRQQIHVLGSRRTESHFVRVDATLVVRAEPGQLQLEENTGMIKGEAWFNQCGQIGK